jgi:hypothetical protein
MGAATARTVIVIVAILVILVIAVRDGHRNRAGIVVMRQAWPLGQAWDIVLSVIVAMAVFAARTAMGVVVTVGRGLCAGHGSRRRRRFRCRAGYWLGRLMVRQLGQAGVAGLAATAAVRRRLRAFVGAIVRAAMRLVIGGVVAVRFGLWL